MLCKLTLTVSMPDPGTDEWRAMELAVYPMGEARGFEGAMTDADLAFFALGIDTADTKRTPLVSVEDYREGGA